MVCVVRSAKSPVTSTCGFNTICYRSEVNTLYQSGLHEARKAVIEQVYQNAKMCDDGCWEAEGVSSSLISSTVQPAIYARKNGTVNESLSTRRDCVDERICGGKGGPHSGPRRARASRADSNCMANRCVAGRAEQ